MSSLILLIFKCLLHLAVGSLSLIYFTFRSSRPKVFCKKVVLRNFAEFTGKHLCQTLFFNKVAGFSVRLQVFSCDFCEISKNNLCYRTPPVAASTRFLISNSYFLTANSCSFFSCKYENVSEPDLFFFCFGQVKSSPISTDSLRFVSLNVFSEAFLNSFAISASLFVFNSFWYFSSMHLESKF